MKQKILWFDLALCSVWALAVLGCKSWCGLSAHLLILLTVIFRVTTAFVLQRREKRGWITLAMFMGLTALFVGLGHDLAIPDLCCYPFYMLGIEFAPMAYTLINCAVVAWLWVIPFMVYIICLFRRRLAKTKLTYKDLAGAILWHDKRARTYSLMMFVAVLSLYAGLAMDMQVCWITCIAAPTLSLWLLVRHYQMETGRLWLIVVAMAIFYHAQTHSGLVRISMLGMSLIIVAYMCNFFYRNKGMLTLAAFATVYIGMLLPSLSIGHNQYTCINYSRKGFYTFEPYRGIFFVTNSTGEKIGLRDRYGLLVEPKYEDICWYGQERLFVEAELRKNGYTTNYDVCANSLINGDDISHELQDDICGIVENHVLDQAYDYNERIEVKVRDCLTDKFVSHVKAMNNNGVSYDYATAPYISEDTADVKSGDFVCDTFVQIGVPKQVLCYSFDVTRDTTAIYNISIKTVRNKMSQCKELVELKDKIAERLKNNKYKNIR